MRILREKDANHRFCGHSRRCAESSDRHPEGRNSKTSEMIQGDLYSRLALPWRHPPRLSDMVHLPEWNNVKVHRREFSNSRHDLALAHQRELNKSNRVLKAVVSRLPLHPKVVEKERAKGNHNRYHPALVARGVRAKSKGQSALWPLRFALAAKPVVASIAISTGSR